MYILRGVNLQPCDSNGKADPYVKLKLGKKKVSARKQHLKKTLNPEFYQAFELATVLPGDSQLKVWCLASFALAWHSTHVPHTTHPHACLKIEVWDHDLVMSDDLIGTTVIDLEDRWYDGRWKSLGEKALAQDERLREARKLTEQSDSKVEDPVRVLRRPFDQRSSAPVDP